MTSPHEKIRLIAQRVDPDYPIDAKNKTVLFYRLFLPLVSLQSHNDGISFKNLPILIFPLLQLNHESGGRGRLIPVLSPMKHASFS
nr:hypothetical protein [Bacillaceae bacterium]